MQFLNLYFLALFSHASSSFVNPGMLGIAGNFGNDIKDFINVFGLKVSPNNFGSGCPKRSYKTQYFYEDSVNIELGALNRFYLSSYCRMDLCV